MAQLLYRLGKFSAKRAFAVIAIWALLIGTAGAAALLSGGKLGTTMTLDGIPSQDLATSLQETFPEAARARAAGAWPSTLPLHTNTLFM